MPVVQGLMGLASASPPPPQPSPPLPPPPPKFLFALLHVPKTGITAVEEILRSPYVKYYSKSRCAMQIVSHVHDTTVKVAHRFNLTPIVAIRDPYPRLHSSFGAGAGL